MNTSSLSARREILLVQLGTPDAPTAASVKAFLRAFLSDPAVVSLPRWIWQPILRGLVLPLRAERVAKLYGKIWLENGSPLRVHTAALAQNLQQLFNANTPTGAPVPQVDFAFSYGQPALENALLGVIRRFRSGTCSHCDVIPLYPQFSTTTTQSVWHALDRVEKNNPGISPFRRFAPFYEHPLYIDALAEAIERQAQTHARPQKYLFSFHSLPQQRIAQGDPYVSQCEMTAKKVAERLNWSSDEWAISYQSKFGFAPWVGPATTQVLENWARQGIQSVWVSAPSFLADCLETLEELGIQNRETFLKAGGQDFQLIPCLNAQSFWVERFFQLLQ